MTIKVRFGKKIAIPSTIEIKHELRLMEAADALLVATSRKERAIIIGELAVKHGLSKDRAGMLVDRFGIGRESLGDAAQILQIQRDVLGAPQSVRLRPHC